MKSQEKIPTDEVISREPLPGSKKIYVKGNLHDIGVAMRQISLTDTKVNGKTFQKNDPVYVYDTSGPYTDPSLFIDIRKGLPRIREKWIIESRAVEQLTEISSLYGRERSQDSSLDPLRFEHIKAPIRAKSGSNVTQLHYARKGIITPEMEYIAIRENQRTDSLPDTGHQHAGHSFGANTPKGLSRRNL